MVLVARKVDAGEEELCDVCDRPASVRQAGIADRRRKQLFEHTDTPVDAEVVRRALRASDERECLAVRPHERQIGLEVAAVDGQDDGHHASAFPWNCGRYSAPFVSRRSTSSSACGTCPISGWASRAFCTSIRSPVIAAAAASRSYAATCCTRPSSSGASGGCGN